MPGMIQPKREIRWLKPDVAEVVVHPLLGGAPRMRILQFTEEQYKSWQSGEYIQRAMPMLSASDREFLLSGMTDAEWEAMWKDDD